MAGYPSVADLSPAQKVLSSRVLTGLKVLDGAAVEGATMADLGPGRLISCLGSLTSAHEEEGAGGIRSGRPCTHRLRPLSSTSAIASPLTSISLLSPR